MSNKIIRYRVTIQDEVYDELESIYSFICQDSPSRAKAFVRSLKNKILKLNTFPRRGMRVKLLEQDNASCEIRFIEHKGYLIFYTIHHKEIILLHVTGPGQNWIQLFLK